MLLFLMEDHQLEFFFLWWSIPLKIALNLIKVVWSPRCISVSNWLKNLKQSKFLPSIFLIINFRGFAFKRFSLNFLSLFLSLFPFLSFIQMFVEVQSSWFQTVFLIASFFFIVFTSAFSFSFSIHCLFLSVPLACFKAFYWHISFLYFSFMFPWKFFNMFYALIFL